MLFGVLTGSYLGDAPKYFLGISTAELAIWKDPLADPLYFLILSLAVGLIHLNIGLILGVVEDVRQGKWKALMTERVVWWAFANHRPCVRARLGNICPRSPWLYRRTRLNPPRATRSLGNDRLYGRRY